MKRLSLPLVTLLVLAAIALAAAQEKTQTRPARKDAEKKDSSKSAPAGRNAAAPLKNATAIPARSPDDEAVRQSAATLVASFNRHDAKSFAGGFTADGEYIDERGMIFHGRPAIEEDFAGFFTGNPTAGIELTISSTRVIAPGVVAADGNTSFTRNKGDLPVVGQCHIVATKKAGKWFIASLHETAATDAHPSHHDQLKALEWLVGEWVEEGPQSHVHFSCRWEEGGSFLIRDFSVQVGAQKTITGTQRIGYDPVTGHLKTWVFDSAGGYVDGYFLAEGTNWIVHTSGVTSDGQMASGTNVFTPIDKHRVAWQAVDRIVGGERISDVQKVTVVRKPPLPAAPDK